MYKKWKVFMYLHSYDDQKLLEKYIWDKGETATDDANFFRTIFSKKSVATLLQIATICINQFYAFNQTVTIFCFSRTVGISACSIYGGNQHFVKVGSCAGLKLCAIALCLLSMHSEWMILCQAVGSKFTSVTVTGLSHFSWPPENKFIVKILFTNGEFL